MKNISGGISGAISNPLSPEALLHAHKYYEEIRHRKDDVYKIAEFTGYTPEQVLKVKNFLFVETHILSKGIQRFDPCFEIAETWQRLADMHDYVQPHDKLLIPHELLEMDLINKGLSQDEAHEITSRKYNYPAESNLFYENLQNKQKAVIDKAIDIVSGGTSHTKKDWKLHM